MPPESHENSNTVIHNTSLPASTSLVGRALNNRYRVERELKRGGFGMVYLARDLQLHSRPVVVKVLLEESYKSEYVVQKFHQEIEALSRIDHPGVVGIIDTGELDDGQPFLVMQFVDGVTLRSILKPEGVSFERTAEIIRQIGRALTAAHEKGIFHRDLKPENVMLQDLGHGEEQVKVIDFGIAKIKDSIVAPSTETNIGAGTVSYMAPEQLSGRTVSPATDVYAMGEIAYEMLAGRKPFNPETGFELLGMQREGVRISPTDLRPGLPAEAQDSILRALSFEPEKRHSRARDFGDELAHSLTRSVTTADSLRAGHAEPRPTELALPITPGVSESAVKSEQTVAATFPVVQPKAEGVNEYPQQQRHTTPFLIAGIMIAFVLAGVWYLKHRSTQSRSAVSAATQSLKGRELSYWLTVQKVRDGHPYQDQFDSSGQEIFENGWKFLVNISSQQTGYLYLLNEGPGETSDSTLNLLFPAPSNNSGASYVSANQNIRTGWMQFDEHQGTEKFWLVWSTNPVPELEAVKAVVNEKDKGTIKDVGQASAVRDFLHSHYDTARPIVEKDQAKKQTNVKSTGDITVNLLALEHH